MMCTKVWFWCINRVLLFSFANFFLTLWDPMDCTHQTSLSFLVSQSLLKVMSIELVILSNHLILYCRLLVLPSIFPSIRIFCNELVLWIKWTKCWSLSFSISPSNDYSGLISFRIDGLISLLSKGLFRVFSSIMIWTHQFFGAHSSLWSNSHIHTWLLKKP